MAQLTDIHIPDDLEVRIMRLVDEGEFVSYEEAVQELLSSGLTAYRTDETAGSSFESEFDDEFEPSHQHEDEYVF